MLRFVLAAVCLANVALPSTFVEGLDLNDDCTTPSGNSGKCIPIKNCGFVVEQLKKLKTINDSRDNQWLQAFRCGEDHSSRMPLVCCPELKSVEDCGRLTMRKFIVGGDETGLAEFPWVARLQFQRGDERKFMCGGSLINDRYVATAAHCFISKTWTLALVRLGDWDDDTDPDCAKNSFGVMDCIDKHQDFLVSKIITHENFGKTKAHNDIALLKLEKPATYSDSIAPVCVPTAELAASMVVTQERFQVTGFGITEDRVPSKRKLKVEIPGQDMSRCANGLRKTPDWFLDSQICAGGDPNKDSCQGDSGGPLMIISENKWHMMGLVSYGPKPCAFNDVPAIYTRFGSFLRWAAGKIELEDRNDQKAAER